MRVYVGADWSARDIAVAVLADGDDKAQGFGKTARTIGAVHALIHDVRSRYEQAEAIHVVIECGAPGWAEMLHEAGAVVHVVDAKQAKRFAESLSSSGAKDDARDAAVLAQMGQERWRRLPVWAPDDAALVQLTAISSEHEVATTRCMQAQQRLRALLKETFPSLERVLHDVLNQWVRRLLRLVPSRAHAVEVSREAFDIAMKGTRSTTRDKVWACLKSAGTLQLDRERQDLLEERVHWMIDDIDFHAARVAQLEKRLDSVTAQFETRRPLESVPGIGMKLASRLLLIAFHREPTHRDEASVLLGASPVFDGSGTTADGRSRGHVKMRRAGSSRGRETAYLLGMLAVQQLPWARARFAYDRARNKGAASIYRSVARSLLRVLTALVKTGKDYDDELYTKRLKAQGLPWAMNL